MLILVISFSSGYRFRICGWLGATRDTLMHKLRCSRAELKPEQFDRLCQEGHHVCNNCAKSMMYGNTKDPFL